MENDDIKPEYLDMGDDDFLKISPSTLPVNTVEDKKIETPSEKVETIIEEDKDNKDTKVEPEVKTEDTKVEDTTKTDNNKSDEWKEYEVDSSKSDDENELLKSEHDKKKPKEVTKPDDEKNPDGTPKVKTDEPVLDKDGKPVITDQVKTVNHEEFYNQIMKPFTVNGKEFKLNNADEAIRLMQMGAGYTKKMQQIQPHLKSIRMLEKNNLLDTGALSYLIDLSQKKPDAIKKLLKDSGIDPLDLNTDDNVTYQPTNHTVSDNEIAFDTALKDIQLLPTGSETIRIINSEWDQTSKKVLWDSPEILGIIQTQRDNGLYDQIKTEVDRQKTLGIIPPSTPFIQAYKIAGDYLVANKSLVVKAETTLVSTQAQPVILETRTAPVKSEVQNSDKAKAAASSQVTSRKADTIRNPLEMPDEEFVKQFNGRI